MLNRTARHENTSAWLTPCSRPPRFRLGQRHRPASTVAVPMSRESAMDAIDLCYMPAEELGTAIPRQKVSPVGVGDAIVARIERLNPQLNAYCTVTAAAARAAAKEAESAVMRGDTLGILHGIPVSIKDLIAT